MPVSPRATHADLMAVEGQAELIGGRIVRMPFHAVLVTDVVERILWTLYDHAEATGHGEAYSSCVGYVVPELPSGRESFCADVSLFTGPWTNDPMSFLRGAPDFAVEVWDGPDRTPALRDQRAAKRADYFTTGTLVVWDVDPVAGEVRKYTPAAPAAPAVFARGQEADAEPAVPGWRLSVDWLMR